LLFIELQQTFSFPFFLLRHNCCFWARATVLSCCRNR